MCQKYYTCSAIRAKVDRYLSMMAAATAEMGTDSTKSDKIKYKKKIAYYKKQIQTIDNEFYATIK